jgi:hypothetical protein
VVVEKIVVVFRARDDCFVGAFEWVWSLDLTVSTKNSFSSPNKKQSFCALNTKITISVVFNSILKNEFYKGWFGARVPSVENDP